MTTEMYGMPFGFQSYRNDQSRLGVEQSLARLHNANAAKAEQEVAGQAELQKAMASMAQPPDLGDGGAAPDFDQLAAQARMQAKKLLDLGMGKQAMDLAKDAAQTLQSVQTAETSQATQRLQELRGQKMMLDEVHEMTAGVYSPQDLLRVQSLWAQRHPDEPLPAEFKRYDPRAFDQMRQMSAQGRQMIQLQIQEEEAASKQAARESDARAKRFREGYLNDMMEFRRKREERLAKDGSTRVTSPTDREVELARTILGQKYSNFRAGDATIAAQDIAARAKRIWKKDPNIDQSTAVAKVIADMEQAGELSIYDPQVGIPFTGVKLPAGKSETRYRDAGKVVTKPIVLDKMPAAKDLVEGNYYQSPKGMFRWMSGKPVPVKAPTAATTLPNAFTDEDADPTDEEGED